MTESEKYELQKQTQIDFVNERLSALKEYMEDDDITEIMLNPDGYVIFEAMKGMYDYKHTFKMKEEDFYDDIKYEKIIEKARKKYKSEKIG